MIVHPVSSTFKDYFSQMGVVENPNTLPINHIFNVKFVADFCNTGKISNEYLGACDVFNKNYLYLFYGRAAFKLNDINAYPVCFVFNSEISESTKIFPFDSGAFVNRRMSDYFNGNSIDEFDIKEEQNIHKIINFFYSKKEKGYLENVPDLCNADNDGSVYQYYKMITEENEYLDERKSSIELIFEKPMNLNSLVLAVIPSSYRYDFNGVQFNSREMKKLLEDNFKCDVVEFTFTPSPKKNYIKIREIVNDFIFETHKTT